MRASAFSPGPNRVGGSSLAADRGRELRSALAPLSVSTDMPASSNAHAVSSDGPGSRSGTASPELGYRGIGRGKLAFDVEGRTALADQYPMQRPDVGALAI